MTDKEKEALKKKIDETKKELKKNPVFNMSLSGKEIFHSNVLAWLLSETDEEKPTETAKNLSKVFCPRDENNNPIKQTYRVLTVLREKNNFDLLIVYYLVEKQENEEDIKIFYQIRDTISTIIEEDDEEKKTHIEDIYEKLDKKKLDSFLKNCKFVIVENKFKAIPDKSQLDQYYRSIPNWKLKKEGWEDSGNRKLINISISKNEKIELSLKEENTTFYLLAPQKALDFFIDDNTSDGVYTKPDVFIYKHNRNKQEVVDKKTMTIKWFLVPYDRLLKELTPVTQNKLILDYYKDFTEKIIKLSNDIIEVASDTDTVVYDFEETIKQLKSIRIHDFYEKLWFSAVITTIKKELSGINKENFSTSVEYSNGMGMLNFMYDFDSNKAARFGIEIQAKQFRIAVYITDKKTYQWKMNSKKTSEDPEKEQYDQIFEWLKDIYKNTKKDNSEHFIYPDENNLDLLKFADFKYIKIPIIADNLTVKILGQKIKEVLSIMKSNEDKFNVKERLIKIVK